MNEGTRTTPREPLGWGHFLWVPWDISASTPGVIYANDENGYSKAIGRFESHVLAADAVCAHNAVLSLRPVT